MTSSQRSQLQLQLQRRPQMPSDAGFQGMAALVHLFCAGFNIGAAVYHLRRMLVDERVDECEDQGDD